MIIAEMHTPPQEQGTLRRIAYVVEPQKKQTGMVAAGFRTQSWRYIMLYLAENLPLAPE